MTDYSTLGTQVTLAKNKIDALTSSTLDAQDLVFLAKALETLGNLLGVNDILGVTNSSILSMIVLPSPRRRGPRYRTATADGSRS